MPLVSPPLPAFTKKLDTTGGYDLYRVLCWKLYSLYIPWSHVRRSSLYWCCILWQSCNYCLLQFFLNVYFAYFGRSCISRRHSWCYEVNEKEESHCEWLWGFVVTWCLSGTHVVLRALAAQASGPRFDFQHIFLHFSHTWNMVHVLAYFCLSCFYETTFLGIIWQMMQTQHWNVSSCLCEIQWNLL